MKSRYYSEELLIELMNLCQIDYDVLTNDEIKECEEEVLNNLDEWIIQNKERLL